LDSGRGGGAISGEKSFFLDWEVTFPAKGASSDSDKPAPPKTASPPKPTPPNTPPGPPTVEQEETGYEFIVATDQSEYVSGRRATLTCQLLRFRKPVGSNDPARRRQVQEVTDFDVRMRFSFPIGDAFTINAPRATWHRGGDNRLWCVPLAPAMPGKYQIDASITRVSLDGEPLLLTDSMKATVQFTCVPAGPPSEARVARILDEFKRNVPEHRAEVAARHRQDWLECRDEMARNLGVNAEVVFPTEPKLGDADYGPYNNFAFHANGYQCSGYTDKTIRCLNRLRFYDPDPQLFVGLNYGPLMRGIDASLPFEIKDVTVDPHHAVVLYAVHDASDGADPRKGWLRERERVLDPWPEQRPKVYTIRDFQLLYGFYDGLMPMPDPEWNDAAATNRTGFPTHGCAVYWNLDWEASPAKYLDLSAKNRLETTRPINIALFSPVAPLVRDDSGRRLGATADGRLWLEIPGGEAYRVAADDGHSHWFLSVPRGDYQLELAGVGRGLVRLASNQAGGDRFYHAYSTAPGEVARMELAANEPGKRLRLADGRAIAAVRVRGETNADDANTRGPIVENTPAGDEPPPAQSDVELLFDIPRSPRGIFKFEAKVAKLPPGVKPFYVWQIDEGESQRTASPIMKLRFPEPGGHSVRVSVYYEDSVRGVSVPIGETQLMLDSR
ncbi:MAG TPA: hypothetical protein PLV92_14435, partial [Pirellulaceae bacterium]|nr:hypothetical protein [Pirellulaceae bacterium]